MQLAKIALSLAIAVVISLQFSVHAQTPVSTLDGVYSKEQAERARAVYADQCYECHGRDLAAYESHTLTGSEFTSDWEGLPLSELFDKIYISMSVNPPGRLRQSKARQITRQEAADLLALILWFNGLPEGKSELNPKAEVLQQIRFESRLPAGAIGSTGAK